MNNVNPGMNNENPGIYNDNQGMNNAPYYENSYYDAQQPIEQTKKNSSGKTVAVGAASFIGGAAAGAAAGAVAGNIHPDPIVIEPIEEPDVTDPSDDVAKAETGSHHHHHHHRHHSHHSHHSSHHHESQGEQHIHFHNDEIHNTQYHVPGEQVTILQNPEDPNNVISPFVEPTNPSMANVVPGVEPYNEPISEPIIEPQQEPYYASNYEDSVNDSDPNDYVAQASVHEDPYSGGAYDSDPYSGGEDYGFDSYNDADPMV